MHPLPSLGYLVLKGLLWGFPGGSAVKNPPAVQEMRVRSLDQEDALEKEMATHSSTLAWRIPGMGEPGGLLSVGSHRVGHDLATKQELAATSEICIPMFTRDRHSLHPLLSFVPAVLRQPTVQWGQRHKNSHLENSVENIDTQKFYSFDFYLESKSGWKATRRLHSRGSRGSRSYYSLPNIM